MSSKLCLVRFPPYACVTALSAPVHAVCAPTLRPTTPSRRVVELYTGNIAKIWGCSGTMSPRALCPCCACAAVLCCRSGVILRRPLHRFSIPAPEIVAPAHATRVHVAGCAVWGAGRRARRRQTLSRPCLAPFPHAASACPALSSVPTLSSSLFSFAPPPPLFLPVSLCA